MCLCAGVMGTKRKLRGFVFSPVCFEKFFPALLVLYPLAEGGRDASHTTAHSLGAFIGGVLAFGCGFHPVIRHIHSTFMHVPLFGKEQK